MKRRGTPFHTDILKRFTVDPYCLKDDGCSHHIVSDILTLAVLDVTELKKMLKSHIVCKAMDCHHHLKYLLKEYCTKIFLYELQTLTTCWHERCF